MRIEIEQVIDSLTVTVDTGSCRTRVDTEADGTYSVEVSDLDEAGGLQRCLALRGLSQGDLLGLVSAAAGAMARSQVVAPEPVVAGCPRTNGKN
jgi:hypothetical protein